MQAKLYFVTIATAELSMGDVPNVVCRTELYLQRTDHFLSLNIVCSIEAPGVSLSAKPHHVVVFMVQKQVLLAQIPSYPSNTLKLHFSELSLIPAVMFVFFAR